MDFQSMYVYLFIAAGIMAITMGSMMAFTDKLNARNSMAKYTAESVKKYNLICGILDIVVGLILIVFMILVISEVPFAVTLHENNVYAWIILLFVVPQLILAKTILKNKTM